VHLARVAASSSAVPLLLSLVTLNNYGGTCGFSHDAGIEGEIAKPEHRSQPAARALMRLREQGDLAHSAERPFLHL
jgi:NTE family protein